jgi:hypothetical protein
MSNRTPRDSPCPHELLEAMNAGYAKLRADPQAWAAELAERELWDQTLADGVDQDEQR